MSLNDDIKLSNIELVNSNVNILHSSETGSLKIDSESGSIKFGHTGINLNLRGNVSVDGTVSGIPVITGPTGERQV